MAELVAPRETAEDLSVPREVAEGRTFTEGETYALVADHVQRETAGLQAEKAEMETQIEGLKAEKAELQTQLDVAVAGKEKAEKDFEDFKAEQARAAEIAALRTERTAKVREAAAHLKDDFFTDERAERWAAMETAEFETYVAELAAVSEGVKATDETPKAETAAAQTSMSGAPVETKTSKGFFDYLGKGC
jgi:hypothetical protein